MPSTLQVDTISELTSANGVVVDGVSIKDGTINGLITEADMWRLTTVNTASSEVITANLERCDDASFTKIGTGMTESSGIFTFAKTGIYLIHVNAGFKSNSDALSYGAVKIQVTQDNWGSTDDLGLVYNSVSATSYYNGSSVHAFFDCTDTSTHKVKFSKVVNSANFYLEGDSTDNRTSFTFIRLGDT